MVKKLQKMAAKVAEKTASGPAAGLLDSQLAQTIKDSAQQIWLAGLGAFAKAQGEGNKVFDTLIKEGTSLHRKSQAVTEGRVMGNLGDVAGRMSAMAGEVGSKANAQWDKLESIFEERTARALSRLGVPTAREVAALTAKVDALAAAVERLNASSAPSANVPKFKPGKALKDGPRLADTEAPKPAARSTRRKAAAAPAPAPQPAAAPARKAVRRKAAAA